MQLQCIIGWQRLVNTISSGSHELQSKQCRERQTPHARPQQCPQACADTQPSIGSILAVSQLTADRLPIHPDNLASLPIHRLVELY